MRRLEACSSYTVAAERLARAVARAGEDGGPRGLGEACYLRIEQPLLGSLEPISWFGAAPFPARFFWKDCHGDLTLVGAGVCEAVRSDDFEVVKRFRARFIADEAQSDWRLLVTARFDLGREAEGPWAEFGAVTVYLPLLDLRQERSGTVLAVNLKVEAEESGLMASQAEQAVKALERMGSAGLAEARMAGIALPSASSATERPDRAVWTHHVESLLNLIESGRLRKCVLARRSTVSGAGTRVVDLLEGVVGRHPETYRFCVQPSATLAFLGASPERLYRRAGRVVASEAVAGTTSRGGDPGEDGRLGAALLTSVKDGLEHESVLQHVLQALGGLSLRVESEPEPHLQRLTDVQHLRTRVNGELKDGVDDAAILSALHPTPAVCGEPTQEALKFLRDHESFDRGLYGGLVGVAGRDAAEFAVAIRSALIQDDSVHLFAGAGIVPGSDPDGEWEEVTGKLRAIGALLNQ